MKQKDQIDQVLEEPKGGSLSEQSLDEKCDDSSASTVTPRSARTVVRHMTPEDLEAIHTVLKYLRHEYHQFWMAKGRLPESHIGHALKRLDRFLWWFD